jgi:hypothetical protein
LRSQRVYGQCWTLQRASDAMWRIYSPNADAVRVRSTARTVAQSLRRALNNKLQGDVYIGRVRYLPNEQLMSFGKTVRESPNQPSSKITAETLLVKRPAFRHEREVRLVFVPKTTNSTYNDSVAYPVDPHALIDQIMMDPRMRMNECQKLKERIRTQLKFGGAIKRSLLYAPPPDLRFEIVTTKSKRSGK